MKILSLDPGGTTGLMMADVSQGLLLNQISAQLPIEKVWDMLEAYKPEVVVIEKFSFRGGRTKIDYSPVEVIGIVREWCRQKDIDLHFQTPSQAKHFWTDERLNEKGVYSRGMPHANDAARHLLFFIEFGGGKNV